MRDILIIIPARYNSTRLPGKALVDLDGLPMIVRTARRAESALGPENVIVATDDTRIADACEAHGVAWEMTSTSHPTGGDRLAEVADRVPARTYINLQGDEPVFDPDDILAFVDVARSHRTEVLTAYCPMSEPEWLEPKYPRLIFGLDKNLIYIGRARVPGSIDGTFRFGFRHVCIYAYPRDAIMAFAATGGRTPIESIEDHEVMRFLELGIPVRMVELSDTSIAVDRPADVERVVAEIRRRGESG